LLLGKHHFGSDALEKQVGTVLTDAFPFEGERCARMTDEVLKRLALPINGGAQI
jgi:hypothetical protein